MESGELVRDVPPTKISQLLRPFSPDWGFMEASSIVTTDNSPTTISLLNVHLPKYAQVIQKLARYSSTHAKLLRIRHVMIN